MNNLINKLSYTFLNRPYRLITSISLLLIIIALPSLLVSINFTKQFSPHAAAPESIHLPSFYKKFYYPKYNSRHVCNFNEPGKVHCTAEEATDTKGNTLRFSNFSEFIAFHKADIAKGDSTITDSATVEQYSATRLLKAYNLPCTPKGPPGKNVCDTPNNYGPETVAIIIFNGSSTLEQDMAATTSRLKLPPCTIADGCLRIVNQIGGSSLPPSTQESAGELSMDTQVVHELCQTCKIIVVEAANNDDASISAAVAQAQTYHPTVISYSMGADDNASINTSAYSNSNVPIVASTGDSGYGTEFPSSLPNIIGAGGTTLTLNSDNSYNSESAWSGAGSGCSPNNHAANWQTSLSNWSSTGCGVNRAVADISADADPDTGVAVSVNGAWKLIGGTSLSAPIIASAIALAGGLSSPNPAPLYAHANYFRDIISGTNGSCSTVMCKGAPGYDGPTGLGSLNGITAFEGNGGATSVPPTPTSIKSTPTGTLPPSPTPTPTSIKSTPTGTLPPSPTPTPTSIKSTPTGTLPPSPTPTPTEIPTGDVSIDLSVEFTGLYLSANPPLQKDVTVELYNSRNQIVLLKTVTLSLGDSGYYIGNVALGSTSHTVQICNANPCPQTSTFAVGQYSVKIGATGYLKKLLSRPAYLTAGTANIDDLVVLKAGDINGDNIIDYQDFKILLDCFDNFTSSTCTSHESYKNADLNQDGKVDILDYQIFIGSLSSWQGH